MPRRTSQAAIGGSILVHCTPDPAGPQSAARACLNVSSTTQMMDRATGNQVQQQKHRRWSVVTPRGTSCVLPCGHQGSISYEPQKADQLEFRAPQYFFL